MKVAGKYFYFFNRDRNFHQSITQFNVKKKKKNNILFFQAIRAYNPDSYTFKMLLRKNIQKYLQLSQARYNETSTN